MGPPTSGLEVETLVDDAKEDCEEIYDDVMPPSFKQDDAKAVDESDYLIPESDEPSRREPGVEYRAASRGSATKARTVPTADGDRYFSAANNEYSSVDCESHLGEEERDELGVYDDVGLPPGEERVNSLYAGSTPGSVSGLTSMNGKESEWEDLEEASCASRCPCRTNDPW